MGFTACRVRRRWLVLAGAFVAVFIELGTMKSFGLLINDMTRDLQTTTAMLGLAIGLSHGVSQILAIINIPLMKTFSARQLIMVGALIGSLGMIFSVFSKSGAHFVWAMGISGAGLSIVVFPCHTCTTLDYFPDAFEKAVSVMLTGGGLGMMLLPLLVEVLHHTYGWRGAITILGALNLHYSVVGALMKPVRTQRAVTQNTDIAENTMSKKGYLEVFQDPADSANMTREEQHILAIRRKCWKCTDRCECDKFADITAIGTSDKGSENGINDAKYKMNNGAQLKPTKTMIPNEIREGGGSTDTCVEDVTSRENGTITQSGGNGAGLSPCSVLEYLKNLFDLRLFINNPTFIFPLLVYFLFGITYACWIVFVIPNAVVKGYTTSEAAFLATTGGAANVVGRFVIGFISSRDLIREEISCCLTCLTAAVAFYCNTFASSFWSLAVLSLMNGFSSGAKIVMGSLLAKKTLPFDVVSTGMCYLFLSQGIGEPVGGAIMGNFYDRTKSYELAFNVAALVEFVSAFIIFLPVFLGWCKSKYCQNHKSDVAASKDVNETMI